MRTHVPHHPRGAGSERLQPDTPALLWHFVGGLPREERREALPEVIDIYEGLYTRRGHAPPDWISEARTRLAAGDETMLGPAEQAPADA